MRILGCNPNGGAYRYILAGLGNAFKSAGHNFSFAKNVDPNFDIYLGCSGWRQIIPKKRKGLVGIHVNPYGPKKVGSVDGGPVIDEPQAAIKWTLDQNPDFVYGYCPKEFIDDYFGYWTKKHRIPVVPIPPAADTTIFKPTQMDGKFRCDIGWVGGYWPYKAKMLDRYIMPLLRQYKCNIYGWGGWPQNKTIDDSQVPTLFASAKICPSVSESHSVPHPVDIPERVFKVPASGGFTIHTPSPAIPVMFGDAIPMAKDPADWLSKIKHYMYNGAERNALAKKQREVILKKHTYYDRCIGIAEVINNKQLQDSLIKAKSDNVC